MVEKLNFANLPNIATEELEALLAIGTAGLDVWKPSKTTRAIQVGLQKVREELMRRAEAPRKRRK